jgi:mRNA-degrading endonuclease YafQ of YafQ-DinJ toxin-antitoxin module
MLGNCSFSRGPALRRGGHPIAKATVRKRQAAQDHKLSGTRSHLKPKGICQTQPSFIYIYTFYDKTLCGNSRNIKTIL